MSGISTLWKAPLVNPVNRKAHSIPGLNPINVYGRVFFFSWFGFFVAFVSNPLSWSTWTRSTLRELYVSMNLAQFGLFRSIAMPFPHLIKTNILIPQSYSGPGTPSHHFSPLPSPKTWNSPQPMSPTPTSSPSAPPSLYAWLPALHAIVLGPVTPSPAAS